MERCQAAPSTIRRTPHRTHAIPIQRMASPRTDAARLLGDRSAASRTLESLHRTADASTHASSLQRRQDIASSNASRVAQRYPSIDDDGRKDAIIYTIERASDDKVIYVGQTTADREWTRWFEHVTKDAWAPWYVHVMPNGIDYSKDRSTWPYDYSIIENLKDVTKFETTVAEQWWMEHYLTQGAKLLNDSTPCTLECFNKRSSDSSLYDPSNIGVKGSYKPSMKAK